MIQEQRAEIESMSKSCRSTHFSSIKEKMMMMIITMSSQTGSIGKE